jgi:hypothetical protein
LKNALLCYFLLLLLCCYVLRPEDIYYIQPFKPKGKEGCKQDTHQSVFCHRDTAAAGAGSWPFAGASSSSSFQIFLGFFIFLRRPYSYRKKRERRYDFIYFYSSVCVCGGFYMAGGGICLSPLCFVCVRLLGCCNQFFSLNGTTPKTIKQYNSRRRSTKVKEWAVYKLDVLQSLQVSIDWNIEETIRRT